MKRLFKGVSSLWGHARSTLGYVSQSQKIHMSKMDYDRYWSVRGFHTFQPRYQIMAETIVPGSTVLDIGCGEGLLLAYLADTKGTYGYGVDLSYEAVKLAGMRGIEAEVADILCWEIEQEYDYIILSEVLEHIANPEEVIAKVCWHFRRALLVSIPNIGYYQHRLRLLFGRFPIQWGWHPAEHLRFWTVIDFVAWIRELGLEVVDVRSSNGFPFLYRYLPNLFGDQVVFIISPPACKKTQLDT